MKRSLVVLLLLFGSGCGTNVAFKQDHRVSIVYPRNRQKVIPNPAHPNSAVIRIR